MSKSHQQNKPVQGAPGVKAPVVDPATTSTNSIEQGEGVNDPESGINQSVLVPPTVSQGKDTFDGATTVEQTETAAAAKLAGTEKLTDKQAEASKKYVVMSAIDHNGERFEAGEEVTLTGKQAESLLALKVIQ